MIKIQRLASISCQTDQNNSKLQKRSNYNVLHRIDVKTIKNVAFRRKTFETTLNYKSNQITTICIDLTSKRSKMLSYVAKHSKQRKTTKVIKIQLLASIRRRKDKKCRVKSQTFKTTQNYKSDQITMNCIDLTSKRSKMLSYVAKHSKQHKTTKVIKLQWLASIWCQNDQNNSKLQKRSNYNELHRFDVKTIKNVELRRKTFKTTQNYKSNQITTICIDLTSKRSKILSYVAKHSKQRKTTKVIKIQLLASIRRRKDKKCRVKSPNIQNNAKLQKWSYYDEFPSIWRQNDKNVELRRKTFKTTLNYKSNQITMTCIDLMSKTIKTTKTTKVIKLQWIASIWRHNDQNNAKLQNNDQITMNLHRFDVKTIKNVETSQNIQNNTKLQK